MAPFAWESNKAILFYFTQNSVSEIEFGVSVQRLDLASSFLGFIFTSFRNTNNFFSEDMAVK